MQQVMTTTTSLTMTSRQIAELTGKEHGHVMRDIRVMLDSLEAESNFGLCYYVDPNGRERPMYDLDEEHTLCLTTKYSTPQRMAIIREWKALKEQTAVVALPNFNNPVEAARAWANEVEAKQVALVALEQAKPAVEFVERYVESNDLFGFRETAKLLNIKEGTFRQFLKDSGYMYPLGKGWAAIQRYIDKGYFGTKTGVTSNDRAFNQTMFTTKGVEWVSIKLQEGGLIS